jgi:DNA-binding NtrC family response regulator
MKKILIIDDEPDILELLVEEFKFHGYDVLSAACGNEAIEILKNERFDVIVSDYKMPNGNGMAVLKFVSTLEKKPFFFFISGQSDTSVEECILAGARHFFSKPFDLELLIKQIEKYLFEL